MRAATNNDFTVVGNTATSQNYGRKILHTIWSLLIKMRKFVFAKEKKKNDSAANSRRTDQKELFCIGGAAKLHLLFKMSKKLDRFPFHMPPFFVHSYVDKAHRAKENVFQLLVE